jgi:two-component system, LytTR family, response regulator
MIRLLIVDDEPLARRALERAVAQRRDIELVDTAVDAIQAIEKLQNQTYDVLLLDIAMPELSGLDLVERLRKAGQTPPAIVYVTAHSEHAIKAFEKRAVDYVLKPFSMARIQEAIDNAKQRSAEERAAILMDLPQFRTKPAAASKVAIKSKGRILLVDPSEILAVKAEGNYVLLERRTGSDILRESISVLTEKLKSYGFIRVHRSILVNTSFVEELHPLFSGDYLLKMTGGREYPVSRSYKKNLNQFAGLWIGTEGPSKERTK